MTKQQAWDRMISNGQWDWDSLVANYEGYNKHFNKLYRCYFKLTTKHIKRRYIIICPQMSINTNSFKALH